MVTEKHALFPGDDQNREMFKEPLVLSALQLREKGLTIDHVRIWRVTERLSEEPAELLAWGLPPGRGAPRRGEAQTDGAQKRKSRRNSPGKV